MRTCGKILDDEWWSFCGETDMGQTLPVQCIECGGEYKLKKHKSRLEEIREEAQSET